MQQRKAELIAQLNNFHIKKAMPLPAHTSESEQFTASNK